MKESKRKIRLKKERELLKKRFKSLKINTRKVSPKSNSGERITIESKDSMNSPVQTAHPPNRKYCCPNTSKVTILSKQI